LFGATGHGFHFNSIDKLYLTFAFLGITIVPFYKSKGIDNTLLKKTILLLSILIAIATFIIGIILLKGNINFNYGDDVSYFFIGFTYLILLFFLFANGVIVSDIINKFRQ
jgi:hypothetical protein